MDGSVASDPEASHGNIETINYQISLTIHYDLGNSQDSNVSLQLRLEDTQSAVPLRTVSDQASMSLLQPNNFHKLPSPTSSPPQAATKLSQKFKLMDREKFVSPKISLDDSVIIEETPEKKSISIIDISDSSTLSGSRDEINLLDNSSRDVNKSPSSVKEILSSSMSEILGLGENIDKVIDNDEDVQSMNYTDCLMDYDHSKEDVRSAVIWNFTKISFEQIIELNFVTTQERTAN